MINYLIYPYLYGMNVVRWKWIKCYVIIIFSSMIFKIKIADFFLKMAGQNFFNIFAAIVPGVGKSRSGLLPSCFSRVPNNTQCLMLVEASKFNFFHTPSYNWLIQIQSCGVALKAKNYEVKCLGQRFYIFYVISFQSSW